MGFAMNRAVWLTLAASLILVLSKSPASAQQQTSGQTTAIGQRRSHYSASSPLFKLVSFVPAVPDNATRYRSFRFVWGDPLRHGEGAFAMAAAVATGRPVSDHEIHERFCPDEPRSCSPDRYRRSSGAAPFLIERIELLPAANSRTAALANCFPQAEGLINRFKSHVDAQEGVVLTLFSQRTFEDDPNEPPSDVHAFALFGYTANNELLLRDAADRVPVTYRVGAAQLCQSLVAPGNARWGESLRNHQRWGVVEWVVRRSSSWLPTPIPAPLPAPRPVPIPSCTPNQRACGLGLFSLPIGYTQSPISREFTLEATTPDIVTFQLAISPAAIDESRRWVRGIEDDWGVFSIGNGAQYRIRHDLDARFPSPLEQIYVEAEAIEGPKLASLTDRFGALLRSGQLPPRWVFSAIVNLVQSIPYEFVPEEWSSLGILAPVAVLGRYQGDCDSKSLLGAVLLRRLGFRTAIAINDRLSHAVMAVDVSRDFGFTGAVITDGTRSYLMIESTVKRPPGDMSGNHLRPGEDPRRYNWRLIVLH